MGLKSRDLLDQTRRWTAHNMNLEPSSKEFNLTKHKLDCIVLVPFLIYMRNFLSPLWMCIGAFFSFTICVISYHQFKHVIYQKNILERVNNRLNMASSTIFIPQYKQMWYTSASFPIFRVICLHCYNINDSYL